MRIVKITLIAALLAVADFAQTFSRFSFTGGALGNSKAVLTINADGSAKLVRDATQPRQQMEMSMRMTRQFRNRGESDDSDETPLQTRGADAKPMTDEELEKELRASVENPDEMFGFNLGKIDKLELAKDDVRIVTSQSFANFQEMMNNSFTIFSPLAISLQNARVEKDADNHLKLTITPQKLPKRYASQIAKALKASQAKTEFRIILPGKIISSSLPESDGNTTGFVLDSSKPESLDAVSKFNAEPVVVVAELGGLKIDQPIESKSMQQTMFGQRQETVSSVPVTEGGEGFTAEASSVTTSTTYEFPGSKDQGAMFGVDQGDGTMIMARIFGPKDRTIQSVTEIKVLKAVDDKGREVSKASTGGGPIADFTQNYDFTPYSKKAANSRQVTVRLGLAEPDAKSIEEVTLQAVVQSVGAWKEMTIPLEEGKTNEVDLAQVLPGAILAIKKASAKSMQIQVDGTIKGPAEIQELDIQIKPEGNPDAFHMQPDFTQWNRSRDKTTRKVALRGFMMQQGAGPKNITLLVRYPTDTKRQRLQFKLTGMDLF